MILHVWKHPNDRDIAECREVQGKSPYSHMEPVDPESPMGESVKVYDTIPTEDLPQAPFEIIGDGSLEDYLAWVAAEKANGWTPAPLPTPVPVMVTCATLRIAIKRNHNITEEMVDAVIAGISDPTAKWEAETLWKKSPTIRRQHPLVLSIAAVFALTPAEVDACFVLADSL